MHPKITAMLTREVMIDQQPGPSLPGTLQIPGEAPGIVLFAHGSGSGRFSPRNRRVAEGLQARGLGTLLFDLLSADESDDREKVFDIPLLAKRLLIATEWLRKAVGKEMPLGYFGASTGGGAALWAASQDHSIRAVVSRGGRPDLAVPRLRQVQAPALLIVGERDPWVLQANQLALAEIPDGELVVIPDASHLFEEPGAMEAVTKEAASWFSRYFRASERSARRVA